MADSAADKKKSHRAPSSGRKADKKKKKNALDKSEDSARQRNPRAFAIQSAVRAERRFRRTEDVLARKQRLPRVDRAPDEPPPLAVVVVGPPRVGKTSLVSALVRNWVRTSVAAPVGPVTVVASKRRRVTLLECNNDVNSMIDAAKCADLVLLLCDASFGFEMEVFEFLSVCRVHGVPRVMGVLTHLDLVRDADALKRRKRALKHRFWSEVHAGAKLFYLSGMQHGEYLRHEVKNLARFISVLKAPPPDWRSARAHVLADRLEDLTAQETLRRDPRAARTVALYGYVRGAALHATDSVHIAGVGDAKISELSTLPDPCPAPGALKKRHLLERERQIYAPFSGVGGVVYDKDAVYIELSGSHSHARSQRDEPHQCEKRQLLDDVVGTTDTLDTQMSASGLRLFSGGALIYPHMVPDECDRGETQAADIRSDSPPASPQPDEPHFHNKWKENLTQKASQAFIRRQNTSTNIMRLVYGESVERDNRRSASDSDEGEIGGLFKRVKTKHDKLHKEKESLDVDECCWFYTGRMMRARDWASDAIHRQVADCFVTGRRDFDEDAAGLLALDDASDGQMYGDFEDLETGEKHTSEPQAELAGTLDKKLQLKAKFDSEYDNPESHRIKGDHAHYESLKEEASRQSQLNKSAFAGLDEVLRAELEGSRPGLYVRMLFRDLPAEFVDNFEPTYPLLVGALNAAEQNVGFVTCKVRKHRWYRKLLKTNDPLVVSLGWRRFQTLPVFSKLEDDFKCRYLKYTPEHVTCNMHFYGPVTPQHAGLLALQTVHRDPQADARIGFRVAATGSVAELDKSTRVLKKLKLVGAPLKIYKKTAFVKDMFGSALEVAKFEGARVRTVSGVRGQIKRALVDPPGAFRATFEDKILMSDIVFCRTWVRVDVTEFYAPVANLLLPAGAKDAWRGMKTLGQLKRERGVRHAAEEDSLYTEVSREPRVFKPLVVPRALQRALPYADKPKRARERPDDFGRRVAVVKSPAEQAVAGALKMLRTNFESKRDTERAAAAARATVHRRKQDALQWRKLRRQKELKKKICRHLSKMAGAKKPSL